MKTLILIVVNITLLISSTTAQNNMNVKDYFNALPEEYIVCRLENNGYTKVEDIGNGYISYTVPSQKEPFFQITLFKNNKKESFIVMHTKNICGDFFSCKEVNKQTKFLQYEDGKWTNVEDIILPEITPKLFYDNDEYSKLLNNKEDYSYKYKLPRYGTTVEIEIMICDEITESPKISYATYQKLESQKKTVYLKFNKELSKFEIIQ